MVEQLGRYQVLERITNYGHGSLYAAHDRTLNRDVALEIFPLLQFDDDIRELLGHHDRDALVAELMEGLRMLATLEHPNILRVYDVGQEQELGYIAMELVRGDSLDRWLFAAERPWPAILRIFAITGRGLVAAHEAGIVHRDFKPDNVLIDELGQPRIFGFEPTHNLRLINGCTYLAPEQMQGKRADARADQFAFCVSLWEALYRERPFRGASFMQLCEAQLTGQVAPTPHGGVPEAIQAVLVRGLAPDPQHRWPTLAALLDALDRVCLSP